MMNTPVRSLPPRQLLDQILDQPDLVQIIQNLEAGVLTRLIDHIGLEDCGEIIAMTTTDQLMSIFDHDLWHNPAPGQEETFDADRFALWLEVMLETGPQFAAQKIEELDEELVVLALCQQLLVLDMDALALQMSQSDRSDEEGVIDKELESCLSHEFDQFMVIAKPHTHWDAMLSLLVELNESSAVFLARLLGRCCQICTEYIEDNGGLYDVLTSEEMIASDVAAQREERRQSLGFVTPSAAAEFLARSRAKCQNKCAEAKPDPATQAYFRAIGTQLGSAATSPAVPDNAMSQKIVRQVGRFLETLREAHVIDDSRGPTLIATDEAEQQRLPISQAMQRLRHASLAVYETRLEEISHLANVLISGCSFRGRRFRPVEAAEAALSTCNLGATQVQTTPEDRQRRLTASRQFSVQQMAELLLHQSMVQLFTAGWRLIYEKVSLYAARGLLAKLARLEKSHPDPPQIKRLNGLRLSLEVRVAAGQPWLFQQRLDELLGVLDNPTVVALSALLAECPFFPEVVPRSVRRPAADFFFNPEQILDVHNWLKKNNMLPYRSNLKPISEKGSQPDA